MKAIHYFDAKRKWLRFCIENKVHLDVVTAINPEENIVTWDITRCDGSCLVAVEDIPPYLEEHVNRFLETGDPRTVKFGIRPNSEAIELR